MGRIWLVAGLSSLSLLVACASPAEPTPAQRSVVQPGIEAERRGNYGFAHLTYRYWANLGVGLAQYRLARLYEQGLGIVQSDAEAADWYRAAAEAGYRPAQLALARLYEEGRGVPQDAALAARWYEAAAAEGDPRGRQRLARMHAGNGGASEAEGRPIELFRPSADVEARLGRHEALGHSLEEAAAAVPDPTEAAARYREEARQGDGLAAFRLAEAFEYGRGVPPDLVEALAWYGIARRQGYAPAAPRVDALAAALPDAEAQEATRRVDQWWQQFGS